MRRPILLLIIMAIAYSQSELMSPDIIRGDGGADDFGGGFFGGGKNNDRDLGDGGGDGGGD